MKKLNTQAIALSVMITLGTANNSNAQAYYRQNYYPTNVSVGTQVNQVSAAALTSLNSIDEHVITTYQTTPNTYAPTDYHFEIRQTDEEGNHNSIYNFYDSYRVLKHQDADMCISGTPHYPMDRTYGVSVIETSISTSWGFPYWRYAMTGAFDNYNNGNLYTAGCVFSLLNYEGFPTTVSGNWGYAYLL